MESEELKKNQHFWHFITASVYVLVLLIMIFFLSAQGKIPDNISVFDFFLLTFATFRLTRLLVHDLVFDFVRDYFADAKYGIKLSMHDLLDCPWCTGAWMALIIVFFYFLTPLSWPVVLVLGVAGLGTLLTILASLMMIKLNGE